MSRLVSKSRESPEITDKCDEMMANIGMKIKAEIAPNRFQGIPGAPKIDLKLLPGAFRAPLGAQEAPRDHPERSRHAPGSSWDRPGSVPGAPGESLSPAQGARKSARERFRVAKIDA